MTERQKLIYYLRREGRTFRSIARRLGVSVTTVHQAYQSAKRYFEPTTDGQAIIRSVQHDTILSNLRFSCLAIRSLQVGPPPAPSFRARSPSQRDSLRYHYWFSNSH